MIILPIRGARADSDSGSLLTSRPYSARCFLPTPGRSTLWGRRVVGVALALLLAGCDQLTPSAPDVSQELAGLVDGLSRPQRALHLQGDAEFARVFSPSDGLGPVFVAASCESCHVGDGKGHPLFRITRFGREGTGSSGPVFDPMSSDGGPQLQDRAIQGYIAEKIPSTSTGIAGFIAPAVSGLGFLDAVDDTTLMKLADPNDANSDGISGRLQLLEPTELHAAVIAQEVLSGAGSARGTLVGGRHIGRFGKKAQAINLLQQVVGAYHQDMGITTDLIPIEIYNPQVGAQARDAVPEPEVTSPVVDAVVFYMKTLKVPPRRNAQGADVVAGEQLFRASQCAQCHLPDLTTGESPIAALSRKLFHPFTDLLLHDMGPDLNDGYTEGSATNAEWRTAPLWGLGLAAGAQGGTARLLHDGRATSIEQAISFHGGEGAASRTWFNALTPEQRRQLLAYLRSL